jgi:hypothetical protein
MPYSGGSSTNAGINYQQSFLALQYSFLYFEPNMRVIAECRSGSNIIDDIISSSKDNITFFNLKFRSPNKNLNWNLPDLKKENILIDFFDQHVMNPNSDIFLISESPCYLISEVFRRAETANGIADISDKLESDYAKKNWEDLKTILNEFDDFKLIAFAKKVKTLTLPISEIEYLIEHRFSHVSDSKTIIDVLVKKAGENSVWSKEMKKEDVNGWFTEKNILINK